MLRCSQHALLLTLPSAAAFDCGAKPPAALGLWVRRQHVGAWGSGILSAAPRLLTNSYLPQQQQNGLSRSDGPAACEPSSTASVSWVSSQEGVCIQTVTVRGRAGLLLCGQGTSLALACLFAGSRWAAQAARGGGGAAPTPLALGLESLPSLQ